MDERKDVRLIYISWLQGDTLSATVQEKLVQRLELPDVDPFKRELELVTNDPTLAVGEDVIKARKLRDLATDFVAVFTTSYLSRTKKMGRECDPDLFCFVRRKGCDENLAMWIVPVERVNLRHVGFKDAGILSLDFPWWHGWRGEDDKVPLPPKNNDKLMQKFDTEMSHRVDEILAHQMNCPICKLKAPNLLTP